MSAVKTGWSKTVADAFAYAGFRLCVTPSGVHHFRGAGSLVGYQATEILVFRSGEAYVLQLIYPDGHRNYEADEISLLEWLEGNPP